MAPRGALWGKLSRVMQQIECKMTGKVDVHLWDCGEKSLLKKSQELCDMKKTST